MRLLAVLLIAGSSLLAQRSGGGGRAMAARPSMPVSGVRRVVAAPPPVARQGYTRTVVVPYGVPYPAYYGGGYYVPYAGYGYDPNAVAPGYGYDPNNGQDPNYGYDPNSQPPPGVLVNRNYAPDSVTPALRDYSNVPLPDPGPDYQGQGPDQAQGPNSGSAQPIVNDGSQVIFLIAMKDHTIFPATAYWIEGGDTLNYITTQGVHNRASLDLVDRDFSKLLNDQRRVDFALPPPPR